MHFQDSASKSAIHTKTPLTDVILYIDLHGYIQGFNQLFEEGYQGRNSNSLLNNANFYDLIPSSEKENTSEELKETFEGRSFSVFKFLEESTHNKFKISYSPLYNFNKEVYGAMVSIKKIEPGPDFEKLFLKSISNSTRAVILARQNFPDSDNIGNYEVTYANSEACNILENNEEDICGRRFSEVFPGIDILIHGDKNISSFKDRFSFISSKGNEKSLLLDISFEDHFAVIYIDPESASAGHIQTNDYHKNLLQNLLECSPTGLMVLRPIYLENDIISDFQCQLINEEGARIIGKSVEHLQNCRILEELPYSQRHIVHKNFTEVLETNSKKEFEKLCFSGWTNISAVPFKSGLVVSLVDISSEKKIYEQLMKNHELLLQSQAAAKVGSFEWNIKENKIFWTPQNYEFWEYPFGTEITEELILAKIHTEDRGKFKSLIEEALNNTDNLNGDFRIVKSDNSVVYMWVGACITYSDTGEPLRIVGTVMDITDRINAQRERRYSKQLKEAQKKLEDSIDQLKRNTQEFKFVTDFMPQMVWSSLPNGQYDFFNNRWYEFTGLSEDESLEQGILGAIHPEDKDSFKSKWESSLNTESNFDAEFRLYKHDRSFRWFLLRAMPLKDKETHIMKWFGTCTDIHEQKLIREQFEYTQDELKQKNQELRRRNTDLDNFVYTASHDLKAPINNIEGLVNGLIEECSEPSQHILLNMINQSVSRFKNTIGDLTEITRVTGKPETPETIELSPIAAEILESLEDYIKQTGAIITLNFEVNNLVFSRKNIRSVLFNLISNAIKYRSEERMPVIKISSFWENEKTVIEVRDNGMGMDERDIPKMFGMFKRLHNHVEGTGVGMYIVKRVIENAGGNIEVSSKLNEGTTFKIYFPTSEE